MNIGRRELLKSLAFAGAIAVMGFSGCLSSPEPTPNPKPTPTPTPAPTPKPMASELTDTTRPLFFVGTENKTCPQCGSTMQLMDLYGVLWWVCGYCGYSEVVKESEILKKYGYST
ncbi:MAG: hypothetical protein PHS47_03875 [Methanocellales archaeon]|nr:hypothetical protein [Methanocellales archaeon]MDD3421421.1 hypothetical protein [Methanocellales archaeon]MDD5446870.1 hypothetical protein [Methanocellales archaeon]